MPVMNGLEAAKAIIEELEDWIETFHSIFNEKHAGTDNGNGAADQK